MSSSEESNREVESALMDYILPARSKERYLSVYDNFMRWRDQNNEKSFSEKVFLTYFNEICKSLKPSSLWGIYSMLKGTMRTKHHIYLQNYMNLRLWLRKRSTGFQSMKSKILTEQHIKKFIDEAPDEKYLVTKVALILAICGQLRAMDLTVFKMNNLKVVDNVMVGVSFDSKTKTDKVFVIREDYIPLVKKYQALRPENAETDRFFLNFRDGRCTKQVIGRHKLAKLPKEIATYLRLPTPESYTGHCFKRSSVAIGASVVSVDKTSEDTNDEIIKFIKLRKILNPKLPVSNSEKETNVTIEVFPTDKDPIHNEDMELTDEIHIKDEEIEQANIDEVYIKTEPFDDTTIDPIQAFGTDNCSKTTSKPSGSGRYLPPDYILEDTDEEDEPHDMVRIRSEDMDHVTTLKSLREESSQDTASPHDTKITVAGKNITILFKNCANVGNITVNIINK